MEPTPVHTSSTLKAKQPHGELERPIVKTRATAQVKS